MKNIYDGTIVCDANGQAVVDLPPWFDALNDEVRYQLTPIGAPAPNLHVAEEVSNNRFTIAGGAAGMKVAWLVSGIRRDAWATAHRVAVEEDKPTAERGYYAHPELHGATEEQNIGRTRHYQQTPVPKPTPRRQTMTSDEIAQRLERIEQLKRWSQNQ